MTPPNASAPPPSTAPSPSSSSFSAFPFAVRLFVSIAVSWPWILVQTLLFLSSVIPFCRVTPIRHPLFASSTTFGPLLSFSSPPTQQISAPTDTASPWTSRLSSSSLSRTRSPARKFYYPAMLLQVNSRLITPSPRSGLRKKVTVFQQDHYSESFITSIFLSIPEGVEGKEPLGSVSNGLLLISLLRLDPRHRW